MPALAEQFAAVALPVIGLDQASRPVAPGRQVRRDALPEHTQYADIGCDLHPSCLTCPLVRCRYDEPGGARRLLQGPRDQAVQRRREEGIAIDALAAEFDLSRRSVFRILARGRAERQPSVV